MLLGRAERDHDCVATALEFSLYLGPRQLVQLNRAHVASSLQPPVSVALDPSQIEATRAGRDLHVWRGRVLVPSTHGKIAGARVGPNINRIAERHRTPPGLARARSGPAQPIGQTREGRGQMRCRCRCESMCEQDRHRVRS